MVSKNGQKGYNKAASNGKSSRVSINENGKSLRQRHTPEGKRNSSSKGRDWNRIRAGRAAASEEWHELTLELTADRPWRKPGKPIDKVLAALRRLGSPVQQDDETHYRSRCPAHPSGRAL